jgi:hypothetical protein
VGPIQGSVALALVLAAGASPACEVPDDGTSLRRALLRVKYLPETELWELQARKDASVQYILSLNDPIRHEGRCYWPIEARTPDRTWNLFYSTPRGEHVLVAGPGGALVPLEQWRKEAAR